jgi:hypothetical protein
VLYAFGRDKFVSDLLNQPRFAAHDQNLQAIVVIEMDMEGGNNDLVVIVLDVGQCGLDVLFVVVVNQSDRARNFFVAEFLAVLDEPVANHVGNGLRTIIVAFLA